ncbi:MAG: response regulator [Actinobacteria bacterium]|nr:response regulator [Actinomycetota bacterium]
MTVARKRILFVDDRPDFAHQPILRLRLEGYVVDPAADRGSALAALRTGRYDVVILDAELPDADGWEILREIRADPDIASVKAIVLMAAKGETGKLVLVPVDAELRRPFSMAELVDAVRRVLAA